MSSVGPRLLLLILLTVEILTVDEVNGIAIDLVSEIVK